MAEPITGGVKLSHTADEVDELLDKIVLATVAETIQFVKGG